MKELDPKQALTVHCPTCKAPPGEMCKLKQEQPNAQNQKGDEQ
jgi:hypothetical protein